MEPKQQHYTYRGHRDAFICRWTFQSEVRQSIKIKSKMDNDGRGLVLLYWVIFIVDHPKTLHDFKRDMNRFERFFPSLCDFPGK